MFSHNLILAQDLAEGQALFNQKCAACHMISKAKLVGPGLANVHERQSEEWLLNFVQSSQSVINKGDAYAVALFEEYNKMVMPDPELSEAQIKSILAYIISKSPTEKTANAEDENLAPAEPIRVATDEDILIGEQLFIGTTKLSNGGPTCVSCHQVKDDDVIGGLLAKDLTDAYERLTTAGIKGILGSPPYPAMQQGYKNNPLNEDEIFQIAAFLENASGQKYYQQERNYSRRMLWSGIIGAFILMGVFPAIWSRRKRRSVNQRIYDRQTKSIN